MIHIKTVKQARALPERGGYTVVEEIREDGVKVLTPVMNDMVAHKWEDDDILLFWDSDGIVRTVEYDSKGAYKRGF